MGRVDKLYQENLALIMSQPWEEVKRPIYNDGSGVKVKRILQVCNQYDLRREFPLGSIRPVNFQGCIKEILWIWQERSNDTHDLGLHIWDQWADEDGFIKECYGNMIGKPVIMTTNKNMAEKCFVPVILGESLDDVQCYSVNNDIGYHQEIGYGFSNQTDYILWSLKNDKSSRRIIASMFDPLINAIKPLQECAFQINLSVQGNELYMTLYQRSLDYITAGLWNVAQYAALMMMFAHDAGLKPAVFTHFIQDAHVYDRHEKQAEELLNRSLFGPIPQVVIGSDMEGKGFYDFKSDSFDVLDYEPKEQIKFEVAK